MRFVNQIDKLLRMGNPVTFRMVFPAYTLFKPRLNLIIDGYIDVIKLLSTDNHSIVISHTSFMTANASCTQFSASCNTLTRTLIEEER